VRRDLLDAAKARPELAKWRHGGVEAIGERYHLTDQRLDVWDQTLPLIEPSATFLARHQAWVERLAELAAQRALGVADARRQSAPHKVLNSRKTHWSGLSGFAEHPQTPMDNHRAENSHRNPVTGRKNSDGSGAVWSAELAARLCSMLQTRVLWSLHPRHWLEALLTACADNGGQPLTDLTPCLPWTMKPPLPRAEPRPPNTS
jgi:hypothetical protein